MLLDWEFKISSFVRFSLRRGLLIFREMFGLNQVEERHENGGKLNELTEEVNRMISERKAGTIKLAGHLKRKRNE